ncbi:hypothetical protein SY27_07140 [Flavobacterium sp. 316]|uniref:TPM domain-containing protein n=1 Tax=Flavobacterium sp. 316 TaxID=1603293 RepID=UPI0005E1F90B|nr:TPM domain-containing protein [Flavobacterium sp. 316]KIX21475.1 hypothetical protein SY27_07140 [Flavobacterium sp. 316]
MRNIKVILSILFISFISCKEENNEVPEIKFDFDKMEKNKEYKKTFYVNDLEKLFTDEQIKELDAYLKNLENKNKIKILVLTIPSKNISNKEWEISYSVLANDIVFNISKSMKKIDISSDEKTHQVLIKSNLNIITEFNNNNYYAGVKKGIQEIASLLVYKQKNGNINNDSE